MYICVYIYMCIGICMYMCILIYIYIYTHDMRAYRSAARGGPRRGREVALGDQGKISHTGYHKRAVPSENAAEDPSDKKHH